MRICLDAQPLLGHRTGIGRYIERLALYLEKHSDVDLYYWLNILLKNPSVKLNTVASDKLVNSRYPFKVIRRLMNPNLLYEVPVDLVNKMDIFHGGNFTTYKTKRAGNVLTIHDLAFLHHPEVAHDRVLKHHTRWVPYSIQLADQIITDSFHSKEDIIHFYKVPENKITVIHLAADDDMVAPIASKVDEIKLKYSLPNYYLLYVGTIEPRKNIPFLLESFAMAKKRYKFPHKLVIAGAKGWKYNPVYDFIQKNKLERDVIFTGFIENEDLPAIYAGATVFLFPSIYEGFGLPVLEAMKCGTPVIASDSSSLPEVVGGAGLLISTRKKDDWIDALGDVVLDPKKSAYYSSLGRERANQFSWEKVALETKKVYQGVLG